MHTQIQTKVESFDNGFENCSIYSDDSISYDDSVFSDASTTDLNDTEKFSEIVKFKKLPESTTESLDQLPSSISENQLSSTVTIKKHTTVSEPAQNFSVKLMSISKLQIFEESDDCQIESSEYFSADKSSTVFITPRETLESFQECSSIFSDLGQDESTSSIFSDAHTDELNTEELRLEDEFFVRILPESDCE